MPARPSASEPTALGGSGTAVLPDQFRRLVIRADQAALARDLGRGVGHLLANVLQVAAVNRGLPPEPAPGAPDTLGWVEERLTVARQVLGRLGRLDEIAAPSPLPVSDVLREVEFCHSVRPGAGQVGLTILAEPGLPAVAMAAGPLLQALLALMANACEATPPHAGRGVRLEARAEGDGVTVRVHDAGPGVPADLRERVFTPFFTTKPPERHLGLGLTAARLLVEEAGGTLWLEAGEGGSGTCACLRLPAWRSGRGVGDRA